MNPRGRIATVPGRRSFTFRSRFGFRNRFHHRNRFAFGFGDCFNGFGFNTFGFNNFGCGSPLFFGGFVDPFFDPFFGASWEQPQPAPEQPAVLEEDSHNRELALQVQELSEEIQAMREDQRNDARRSKTESQPASQAPKDNSPNAILVFRDGLQLPVRNYAIAGGTIFVLDNPNQKIALSKLDIPATEQINDKNGLEIHLPKQSP